MPTPLRPTTLTGRHVVPAPLSSDHVAPRWWSGRDTPAARDTAVCSVARAEWAAVRDAIGARLA